MCKLYLKIKVVFNKYHLNFLFSVLKSLFFLLFTHLLLLPLKYVLHNKRGISGSRLSVSSFGDNIRIGYPVIDQDDITKQTDLNSNFKWAGQDNMKFNTC